MNELFLRGVSTFVQLPHSIVACQARFGKVNVLFNKEVMHGSLIKFLTPITPKHFYFAVKKIFNCTKNMIEFQFTFHRINPRETRKVINNRKIVLESLMR